MDTRPNILFIITHDTGRHAGGYGLGPRTPHLERLAAEGVRFEQMYCAAPQCSPSRASVLTGLMPHSHGLVGLTHRGFRLRPGIPTLPKVLGAAGYETWLFGLQHESPDPAGELGYRHVVPGEPHRTDCHCVARKVVEMLADAPRQPFFASVGFSQTHRRFTDSGATPLDDVIVPPYLPDCEETRRDFCDLNMDIAKVDQAVGEILDALERYRLVDNTLVVFTTDHGVAFPGAKGTLFDPGVGIAAVMRGPGGFDGGRCCAALVSNLDFLPTFCDLAETATPAGAQGISLLSLVAGKTERVRDEVFIELTYHAAYDPMRGVRTPTHKYIRSYEYRPYWFGPNVDDGYSKRLMRTSWQFREPRPRELLFDLVHDPNETHNLARDPALAEVLTDLRDRVDRFMDATEDAMSAGVYPLPPGAILTPPTNFEPEHEPE